MAQRYHANNPAAPQLFHSSLPPLVPPTEQLGGMKDRFLSIPLSPLLLTPPPPLAVRSKGIQTAVTDLQTAVQPAVYQNSTSATSTFTLKLWQAIPPTGA